MVEPIFKLLDSLDEGPELRLLREDNERRTRPPPTFKLHATVHCTQICCLGQVRRVFRLHVVPPVPPRVPRYTLIT